MQKLIKNGSLADDNWTILKAASGPEVLKAVPRKNLIVPLQFWKSFQDDLLDHNGSIAIWLDSHEQAEQIGDDLKDMSLIALNFPVFSDGRSYSNARELRQRFEYKGEIRAIGDVLRDQLYYMSRCGFDSFDLRHDQDAQLCLEAFSDFKTAYQSSIAEPVPLFRRR
ncbi:MAG: oxidoreductase [SAR86 cluster bacterium]|uniref:Oxidoreductase n=1 Tax=SAR86 cluster bacterium TaxID=2030880 RepID=A0A2A5BBK9_9GAMM|nr:MAG: oxidoreductase [SAR86 cluster bacterium]